MSIIQICEYYSDLPSISSYHYNHAKGCSAKEPCQNIKTGSSRTYNLHIRSLMLCQLGDESGCWCQLHSAASQILPVPTKVNGTTGTKSTSARVRVAVEQTLMAPMIVPVYTSNVPVYTHFTWSRCQESRFIGQEIDSLEHEARLPACVDAAQRVHSVFEPTIEYVSSAYGVHDGVDLTSSSEEEIESSEVNRNLQIDVNHACAHRAFPRC